MKGRENSLLRQFGLGRFRCEANSFKLVSHHPMSIVNENAVLHRILVVVWVQGEMYTSEKKWWCGRRLWNLSAETKYHSANGISWARTNLKMHPRKKHTQEVKQISELYLVIEPVICGWRCAGECWIDYELKLVGSPAKWSDSAVVRCYEYSTVTTTAGMLSCGPAVFALGR